MKYLYILFVGLLVMSACKSDPERSDKTGNITPEKPRQGSKAQLIEAHLEAAGAAFTVGDIVPVDLELSDSILQGKIYVEHRSEIIDSLSSSEKKYNWDTKAARTGSNELGFFVMNDGNKSRTSVSVSLLSDIKPKSLKYKVVNVFPHDRQAFTQGLFYQDGFLYEATGLRGESTVRKVNPETGEVLRSFAIPPEIFGEGITFYDGKIAQLSWDSGRGFVYNFSDFKLIEEFTYAGEGWGLEHQDGKLYMTDGTHIIRVLNDQTYSIIDRLEVYDHDGPVKYLNELEFINGKLWANIYRHEKIAVINPSDGKVEAYISLKSLLPMNDVTAQTDVLNGIAYDQENDRIFVTGKKWPKLFEIEVK